MSIVIALSGDSLGVRGCLLRVGEVVVVCVADRVSPNADASLLLSAYWKSLARAAIRLWFLISCGSGLGSGERIREHP